MRWLREYAKPVKMCLEYLEMANDHVSWGGVGVAQQLHPAASPVCNYQRQEIKKVWEASTQQGAFAQFGL